MHFDASLRQRWQRNADNWQIEIPTGWMQGRSVFGGLSAASAAALATRELGEPWALRSMSVQFLRPTTTGIVDGSLVIHRQGKGVTFAEVRLSQQSELAVLASLVFARHREGAIAVAAQPWTKATPPGDLDELPYLDPNGLDGMLPEFTQHIAFRWASGQFPYTGGTDARLSGYCRFRQPSGDVEAVIGLLDAWPCPTLSMLSKPAPASSVQWTAHILEVPEPTDDWFRFSYETIAGGGGYHTAVGNLYAPDGRLVGWTEQLVAVFA